MTDRGASTQYPSVVERLSVRAVAVYPTPDPNPPAAAAQADACAPDDRFEMPANVSVKTHASAEVKRVFREIFEQESSYVWNSLRRLGVREADRLDVAHEVFVVLHRRLAAGEFDASRPVRPWLFAAALRAASDYRRLARHRFEMHTDDAIHTADAAPPADERLAAEQERALVIAALERVELDRRAVFVLHDIDGYAVPEIARALDVPLNTAYSRLRLAREDFRAAVLRMRAARGGP